MINFRRLGLPRVRHVQGDEPRRSLHRAHAPLTPPGQPLSPGQVRGLRPGQEPAAPPRRRGAAERPFPRARLRPRLDETRSVLRRPLARGGPLVRGRRLRARPPLLARDARRGGVPRDPRRPRGSPGPDPRLPRPRRRPGRAPQRAPRRVSQRRTHGASPRPPRRGETASIGRRPPRDRPRRPRAEVRGPAPPPGRVRTLPLRPLDPNPEKKPRRRRGKRGRKG